MEYRPGYAYHIRDEYFLKANDSSLMANKENGAYRPTYYCLKDEKTQLIWVVPLSTQMKKYQALYDQKVNRYGECLTIVIGSYDGREVAFLLQNMFPITEEYIDHIHTRKGNPVPVHRTIQGVMEANMRKIRPMIERGVSIVFTDAKRLQDIMLAELEAMKQIAAGKEEGQQ